MKIVLMFYTFSKINKWRKILVIQRQRIYSNYVVKLSKTIIRPRLSDYGEYSSRLRLGEYLPMLQ